MSGREQVRGRNFTLSSVSLLSTSPQTTPFPSILNDLLFHHLETPPAWWFYSGCALCSEHSASSTLFLLEPLHGPHRPPELSLILPSQHFPCRSSHWIAIAPFISLSLALNWEPRRTATLFCIEHPPCKTRLCISPHGCKMAAAAPLITSSPDTIQSKKGGGRLLFECLSLIYIPYSPEADFVHLIGHN